jgi:methylglutaconyl-CoA hydratase
MTTLQITHTGAVARITLNRPEVRNAFNDEVIAELTQAFTQLGQDAQVRAIVLATLCAAAP